MAEKKYYWLKLKRDFFKRHDIRIIEGMPNGKDYILFYLKLLLESIDHEGELRFSETIPYNEQMLSVITDTNIDIVKSAMQIFIELNMIEILDDSTIYMAEVKKLTGSETEYARKKREYRQKLLEVGQSEDNVRDKKDNVRQEIELEKEIDIEKDNNISPSATTKATKHKYGEYKNVLLTDDEYAKLQEKFPNDYMQKIENLSEGIALKGYKYKSHYLAILKWARNDNGKAVTGGDINGRTDGKDKLEGWKPTNGLWI